MSEGPLIAPEQIDDTTIRLYGIGPTCPECGGPTHAVTEDTDARKPWWCQDCNLRLSGDGDE